MALLLGRLCRDVSLLTDGYDKVTTSNAARGN